MTFFLLEKYKYLFLKNDQQHDLYHTEKNRKKRNEITLQDKGDKGPSILRTRTQPNEYSKEILKFREHQQLKHQNKQKLLQFHREQYQQLLHFQKEQ